MLISASLSPCVQQTTPVHPPPHTPTTTPTPCVTDDTRHRYEISADTDAAEHAAPIEEKCCKTEDTHSRHTCTAPKLTLCNARNLFATHRWRSAEFTSAARMKRNLWCPSRWGWGVGCSWKWNCVFSEVSKVFFIQDKDKITALLWTPRSKVLETPKVVEQTKKFFAFYKSLIFITMFTRTSQ
jgi:hypothetical protein